MRFELRSVTAGYGETVALREASLVVPSGLVVALLGPNGAGKTTLLRVASGLLAPRSGQLLIDDHDVTGSSSAALTQAGLCHVTEGRSVFPSLTVRENLRMFARAGEEREALDRAVDAFPRLGERLAQIAGTMSGGEQQMLALARAYVSRASVVLLDEVSMGLAPIVVDEIFAFLDRLVADGSTSLLLVEQYVTKALAIADHVYMLDRGRIVFCDEPDELDADALASSYLGASA